MTSTLPTLADEMLALLLELMIDHASGVPLKIFCERLGADLRSVRNSAHQLNHSGRADLMRRLTSREHFIAPLQYRMAQGFNFCAHCSEEFRKPDTKRSSGMIYYSDRRTCSRRCHAAFGWRDPEKAARRRATISRAHQSPERVKALAAHNKRRWADPEQRRKMSEQNKREWADPIKRALRIQSIAEINGSPEMRNLYSDLRKDWWKNPAMRQKMLEGMIRGHGTPEARAKAHERMKARWQDPVWRKKWLKAVRENGKKAVAAIKGKKQSAETIRKRVETTKRTKEIRRAA